MVLSVVLLEGCGNFFQPVSSSGSGSGGGGGTTSGFVYVGNATSTTLAGFALSSAGALSAVKNSPYSLPVNITSMAVNPANTFLYGATDGYVYVFSISSTGALTIGNSGNPVATGIAPSGMRVDSTGKWLLVADAANLQAVAYGINTSTGTLTSAASTVTLDQGTPSGILITPNNADVYVSLGTGGVDILSLNSTTGALTSNEHLKSLGSTNADLGMASDSNSNYLFLAETNTGVRVLTIGTNGHLTEISGSPYTAGTGPIAIVVDPTNAYVYVANRGDSTISGFSLASTGTLTALTGSPFSTGSSPIDLAFDRSKTYLAVACSGGSPDLQIFKLDSTTAGKLDSVTTTSTGASSAAGNPVSLGATHY